MKSNNLLKRLRKDRPMDVISIRMPRDVIDDLKRIAPLLGFAFMNFKTKTVLIPLVQHFESYENSAVSQTAFRLIGLQPLPNQYWLKLDAKVPADWENETTPINSEFEAGKMFSPAVGIFAKALVGIGPDRPFDWGATGALRFNF